MQALTRVMTSARQSLNETKAARVQGDKRSTELTVERSQLDGAVQGHLLVVQAGDMEATLCCAIVLCGMLMRKLVWDVVGMHLHVWFGAARYFELCRLVVWHGGVADRCAVLW